jgi:hypothetical protein
MIRSGYGEETFWVWFEKNFNSSYSLPKQYTKEDVVLRYSTVGPLHTKPGKSVALCWELLPEMQIVLEDNSWDSIIGTTYETARVSDYITVASRFSVPFYSGFGKPVDILPIGVDTDLFRPFSLDEKYKLKLKYNIPLDKKIGFWCGTPHKMKGSVNLQKYADEHLDIYWVVVWYQAIGSFVGAGQQHFTIDQKTMAELMNCADFQLGTSILRPYYIIEYEGMACNLPRIETVDLEKDFSVGVNPRDDLFENGWDRSSCKKVWDAYINTIVNK